MIPAITLRRVLEELAIVTREDLPTIDMLLKSFGDFPLAQLAIVLSELNKKVNQLELERARKGLTRT